MSIALLIVFSVLAYIVIGLIVLSIDYLFVEGYSAYIYTDAEMGIRGSEVDGEGAFLVFIFWPFYCIIGCLVLLWKRYVRALEAIKDKPYFLWRNE